MDNPLNLGQASALFGSFVEPIAFQLRFLQTMREISSEHTTTTTTFLPLPIGLFGPFLKHPRINRFTTWLTLRA